jgi:hypothetical protein
MSKHRRWQNRDGGFVSIVHVMTILCVVAYGYPVADVDSYSSFQSGNTSDNGNDSHTDAGEGGTKEKISATNSGEEGYVP